MRPKLSDEEVRAEIERLEKSEDVKRGRRDANAKRVVSKERRRLYQLRWAEKRGKKLAAEGALLQ